MTHKYYYSTERDVALCKEGYDMLNAARRERKAGDIWSIDLGTDAQSATRFKAASLPVLVSDQAVLHGDAAVEEIGNFLKIARTKTQPSTAVAMSDLNLPPIGPPAHSPAATPASVPPSPNAPSRNLSTPSAYTPAVEPMYVLYTDDSIEEIVVPIDGYVTVQSYSLVRTTIARDKLPNYLRAENKPLPVLVTMKEDKPSVFYGTAAKDFCKMLCLLHGGAMLR